MNTVRNRLIERARALLVFPGLMAGCGTDETTGSAFTVTDSAGVTIVSNAAPAWAPDEVWRIGPEPTTTIGDASGRDGTDFGTVSGAIRFDDGRVMIADAISRELRFFGPDGDFLMAAGCVGDGPGEFQLLDGRLGLLRTTRSRLVTSAPSGRPSSLRTGAMGAPFSDHRSSLAIS